ncbi:hypothetical protein HK102_004525 [Quaeritorhiza haematococci]|nr:hypothetical protein HK102_004525 [Quaeritorhiza haematococci]
MSNPKSIPPLARYRLMSSTSGLRVSPLCLGTMGFGDKWSGGKTKEEAEKIFDLYISKGGNFIDTANKYQDGQAEEWLGEFIEKRGIREKIVLATKYSMPMPTGSINQAGNHRKNMFQSLQASLKRLKTDYVDILFVHFWDFTTPVEELMRGLNDLVSQGLVHYVGISDTPAWIVAKANMYAESKGWVKFTCYQGLYHLGVRDMEREVIPMAIDLGVGLIPWGVMGQGKFTGKHKRGEPGPDEGRKGLKISDRDFDIQDVVIEIAKKHRRTASQIALRYVLQTPGMTTALLGPRTLEQLEDNIAALEFELDDDDMARLLQISAFELGFPHDFLGGTSSYRGHAWLQSAGYIE